MIATISIVEEEAEVHLIDELVSQVAHPSDPAHEGGAGGGDPLQVGDGKGARRRELGDRCFATVGNLGERRNGGKHALDHRSSFSSFRAFGPGAGRLSDRVDPRGREQGLEIASVTGNARARGLRPGEDFAILRLLLVDQRTRDVQDGFHAFAERLGLPPRAFHRDHYDLPAELRDEAIALGAQPVSSREVLAGPDVVNRGFVHDGTSADILEEARKRVMLAFEESAEAHVTDPSALQQNVRRVLKRYFFDVTQRKPVILPVIMEV